MLSVFRHLNDRSWLTIVACVFVGWSSSGSLSSSPVFAGESTTKVQNNRLSRHIDRLVDLAKKRENVVSAPPASDAEFMRRVSLDLTGKIPAVAELRSFLSDQDPLKREKLIDRLLARPGFVVHFTNTWRDILLPEAVTDLQTRAQVPEFDAWLRSQLQENVHYDELVKKIINAPLDTNRNRQTDGNPQGLTPRAYYITKQLKPENLAAGTSRAFLGVRIECAQCHDHPFDNWKQHQFWQYAAFFSNIDQRQLNSSEVREISEQPHN